MLLDYIRTSVTKDNQNKQQIQRRATYSINKCDSNNNKYGQQQLDNTPVTTTHQWQQQQQHKVSVELSIATNL